MVTALDHAAVAYPRLPADELAPDAPARKNRVMTLSYAVDRYCGELARAGRAVQTIHRYRRYLDQLADMYPHHDVDEITTDMARRLLDLITTRKGAPLDVDTIGQRIGIIKNFFAWLRLEALIPVDPVERIKAPRRKNPVENDRVVTISDGDVKRMLAVAKSDTLTEKTPEDRYRSLLCLGLLAYTGSRRHAVAQLRLRDYDPYGEPHPTLTFHEKGGKQIRKPVSENLALLIEEASLAGVWNDDGDYLIPSLASPRKPVRDDRIVWRIVKDVAEGARVITHVHAFRAAFACFFIDAKPDQILALKELLGHSQIETTMLYLRRHDRQKNMATVVDLNWGERLTQTVEGGIPGQESAAPSASDTPQMAENA